MAATTNNSSLVAAEILPDTLLDHYRSLVQIFPDSSDQIIQNLLAFEGQPNLQDRVVQAILKESTDGNDDFLAMSPANVSIADQLLLMAQELAAKFPDANANVIYSRLERAIGNLVPLEEEKAKIQAELERPPEDDQPGPSWKDAGIPPLERQSHSTREHFAFLTKKEQGDFVSLLQMFPTIDNKFLLEEIAVNCKTAEELIDKFSQDDSYPKKADRLKREQLERHRNTLLSPESFDSREFILTFPDPERYFADIQRPVSSDYADLARVHLANVFPHLHLDFIKSTLARYNNHLSPALRELQADTTGTGKKPLAPLGKRSLPASNKFEKQPREEKLPWPAKHDEIFFRELQFLTFEEKIQKFLKWRKAEAQLRIEAARERGEVAECPICLEETSQEDLVFCVKAEPHGYCEACVRSHAEVAIGEGSAAQVQCLQTDCDGQIRVETLRHLISPNLLSLLLRKRAEDDIQSLVPGEREMIESCPFCPFAVILDTSPEEDKLFRCQNPDCLQESCR